MLSNPGPVWTNGKVTLTRDLVFGISVLSEDRWYPLEWLDETELDLVRRLVDHSPGCPFLREVYHTP